MITLYISPTSPYARITRIIARDCGAIDDLDEVIATKRVVDSDFFEISPVARVPALVVRGRLIADTRDIVGYFEDTYGGGWLGRETPLQQTYRHVVMGLLDGLAVWARELKRDVRLRDANVIEYECHRAEQALRWLDANALVCQAWSFAGVTLAVAIEMAQHRGLMPADRLGKLSPDVMAWVGAQSTRDSVIATRP